MMREEIENIYWGIGKSDAEDDGLFNAFYKRWMDTLENVLLIRLAEKGRFLPKLDGGIVKIVIGDFRRTSLRTLMVEMQLCDDCNELIGKSEIERYFDFANVWLQNDEYLHELYQIYPEMYAGMCTVLNNTVTNLERLIERFSEDRNEIKRIFGYSENFSQIVRVGGGNSDNHRGGQKVYWVDLDNGKRLVYKPRSLAVDEAFRTLVTWISDTLGIPYWWNKVWDRDEYGWCEWVQAASCSTKTQLEDYYQRNGILLGISYLLGSEDMHYENLIACGEYPILVDLEMAIGSRGVLHEKDGCNTAESLYQESVLQTGLLPLYTWNEAGEGINVGAINGGGGQLLPIRMPVVAQAGTVKMHIEYVNPKSGEGKNLATLNGQFIEPYEFVREIQKGFGDVYRFIWDHQQQMEEHLRAFSGASVRYLIRDTQQYSMMLTTSWMPQFLADANQRRETIDEMLCSGEETAKEKIWIESQEKTELCRGDIPYFCYDPWKTGLRSGTGEIYEEYFPVPVIACVTKRLHRLSASDLRRQQKMIRNALLIGAKGKKRESVLEQNMDCVSCQKRGGSDLDANWKDIGMSLAVQIGDLLLEEAVWSDDRTDLGWVSIVMAGYRERGYLIRPMDMYLYGGLSGIAVFLAELFRQTGKVKYKYPMELLIQRMFAYTDRMPCQEQGELPTGAFTGEMSIAYAYLLLYKTTEDTLFLKYMEKHSRLAAKYMRKDNNYDVLGGNAGAVLVLLKIYELTRQEQYIKWAENAGDCLIQSAATFEWGIGWKNPFSGIGLTGFAHGSSGIMLALTKLGYYTGRKQYYHAALQAYTYENHFYLPDNNDWADLRYEEKDQRESGKGLAWCHGCGGILAAYYAALPYADYELGHRLQHSIAHTNMKGKEDHETKAYCLCHGRMGNAGLLYAMERKDEAEKGYKKILLDLTSKKAVREILDLQECDNFGLLSGISGIGYGCLCGEKAVEELLMV